MQASRLLSHSHSRNSTSFGSFSATVDLAAIAARVVEEFRNLDHESDHSYSHPSDENRDDDFEFVFHSSLPHPDSIATADEIFCNGQIRPSYPYSFFSSGGGGSATDVKAKSESTSSPPPPLRHHRPALRKLMSEERDSTSCSSCEVDEDLIGVPPETYCVWTPKRSSSAAAGEGDGEHAQVLSSSPSRRKIKSNSAGSSSKRWKLRELLYVRSNSDGKEQFVLLAPIKKIAKSSAAGEGKTPEKEPSPANGSAAAVAETPTGQSSLSYRKDMVGILANVNGLSRNLHPF